MRNVKTPTAKFPTRSLQGAGTPHTLRLLMDQQQKLEIGIRIRELREASPHTNRSIGDAVDVSERAVTGWISGRGISWEHVQAVAKVFRVDPDWLWSGREKGETPDLSSSQLDRIEALLLEVRQEVVDQRAEVAIALDLDAAKSTQQKPKPQSSRSRRKSS